MFSSFDLASASFPAKNYFCLDTKNAVKFQFKKNFGVLGEKNYMFSHYK